jgi:Calcineurin-like phosphoesterase/Purple acid Phosphatase, N-terminal domain
MISMRLTVTKVCRVLALALAAWLVDPGQAQAAAAQMLIVPGNAANSLEALGSGQLKAANYRIQELYGAPNFTVADSLYITELRYRPDATHGEAFSTTIGNIEIRLSTTTREPDGLSLNYSENSGPDETLVYSGALSISSQFTGPPGQPKDFDIIIPLQTPFLYNPAAGNLLVDLRNFTGSTASLLGGNGDEATDWSARLGGPLNAAQGTAGSKVTPLQIVYFETNGPPIPPAPTMLLRGPYLQRATMTNILVCWRTSRMTNGIVNFGLSPGALTWQATGFSPTNNHYVLLTNLAPNTKYYYSIGATDTNFVGGPDYHCTTLPATAKPTRIWAMGDFGITGLYGNGALPVRDAFINYTATRPADLWLMLGDNAYNNGTDAEFQRGLFNVYPTILRNTLVWSTIGNHETYSADAQGHIAYFDIFKAPTAGEAGGLASGTLKYYSFDYGNIHFVCLDSEFSDHSPNGPMATWLAADLEANTKDWMIAYWHSPPYTWGSHNSDNDADTSGHLKNMREIFVPILEAYGVDLVLGGHSHNYERSFLLDGHYGKSWTLQPSMIKDNGNGRPESNGAYVKSAEGNQGAVYIVAGSGGFATSRHGHHPAMFASILETGSLILDVDGNRLDGKFLRESGAIEDTFTIIKQTVPQPLRVTSINVVNGLVTLQLNTVPGRSYRIERTLNLGPATWVPAGADFLATGSTTTWTVPVPPNATKAFYQAVELSN